MAADDRVTRITARITAPGIFVLFLVASGGIASSPTTLLAQSELTQAVSHTIVTTEQVELGTSEGGGAVLDDLARAFRAPWGDYLLLAPGAPVLQVFDSTGQLEKRLERSGEGPGEFRFLSGAAFVNDSVVLFDGGQARMTVMDRDLNLGRVATLPFAVNGGVEPLHDSLIVIAEHLPTRDGLGHPFQLIDVSGEHIGSFGGSAGAFRVDRTSSLRLIARPRRVDRFWSARLNVYRIEEVTVGGTVVRAFGNAPEFFPDENDGVRRPDHPPPPIAVDIQEDARGLIWIQFAVADTSWREGVDTESGLHGGQITDWNDYYDSILDVIDPHAGRVVARRRFDQFLTHFPGPGTVGHVAYTAGVHPVLRVERVYLVRRKNDG